METRNQTLDIRLQTLKSATHRCAFLFLFAFALSGCQQLWEQPSVQPYEQPQLRPTSGTIAVDAPEPIANIARLKNPIATTSETISAGHLAYRRYCHQCHGANLDGDATVGPSLPYAQLNLLLPRVAAMSDGEIFSAIWEGTKPNLPPEGTTGTVLAAIGSSQSEIRNPQSAISYPAGSVLWTPPEPAVSPPLGGTMTTTESWHVVIYVRFKQQSPSLSTQRSPLNTPQHNKGTKMTRGTKETREKPEQLINLVPQLRFAVLRTHHSSLSTGFTGGR